VAMIKAWAIFFDWDSPHQQIKIKIRI